jgi:hypothetical protein
MCTGAGAGEGGTQTTAQSESRRAGVQQTAAADARSRPAEEQQ